MSTPVKKSSTIILIGDKGGRKADFLLLLYAFCTGKTASDFSKIEAVPSPTKTIDRTSLYSFTYSSGLQLQVVDAPECAPIVDTAQIASFKDAASSLVTMVDAIVVLADDKQEKIGAGATSMLDMLSSTFPRPIEKNIFLVLTYQGGTASTFEYEKGVWPEPLEWLAINQVLSVESVANLRLNVKDDRRLVYESKYNDAINQVRVLFACMEQSIVQAWDMRDLYLEAAKTESQLFDTLGVSGSSLELSKRKEDVQMVVKLVDRYSLLAASPDFIPHLKFMVELAQFGRDIKEIGESINKLEGISKTLGELKEGNGKFPREFVVC